MTCLCITRNRRQWLPKAIECYQRQTYPRRELLIVADGEDVFDLVPSDDQSIRLIHLDRPFAIGEKRNFGCQRAAGEIIAHLDDDDWSAAGRLAEQVQRLSETGKAVTGYYGMRFTDGSNWWAYEGERTYALGTSLCYRREWWQAHPFKGVHIGEDLDFATQASAAGQLVSTLAKDAMYASVHSGNTSPRQLSGGNWKRTVNRGLSVIVPSKTASNLFPCLGAVTKNDAWPRIIVVDDGIDWASHSSPPVTIVPGVKPFVFARNVNLGIAATGQDDVILLNDDALLQTRGGFTAMQRMADELPEFGVIAATCNNVGNVNQHPRPGGKLREDPRMVCFVCVLIPRRTIEAVGLLDDRFVNYGCDDDDYCLRVRKAGLRIGIYDGCFVDHGKLKSTFRGHALANGNYRKNLDIYRAKWGAQEAARVGTFHA